jgi:two-component system phosphate regulon sensor histidine kinase PhoR
MTGYRRLRLVVVSLAVALAGIVLMQVYWINRSWRIQEKDFSGQVSQVLQQVVSRLDDFKAVIVFAGSMGSDTLFYRSVTDSVVMTSALSGDSILQSLSWTGLDNVHEMKEKRNMIVSLNSNCKTIQIEKTMVTSDSLFFQQERNDSAFCCGSPDDAKEVVERMMQDYASKDVPLEQKIPKKLLDSLLSQSFADAGIDLPYEYAIGSELGSDPYPLRSPGFLPEKAGSAFSTAVWPKSFSGEKAKLLVYFPDASGHLMRGIWIMMAGSFILILFVAIVFGMAVSYMLRQKKVAEMKNDFISNMTHEFRTPIATIAISADAMKNPKVMGDQEQILKYSGVIREETNRMNDKVECILRLALMEKGDYSYLKDTVDLNNLTSDLIQRFAIQASEKGGQISFIRNAEKGNVTGDRSHLSDAISNLIDNAVKYTVQAPAISIETRNAGNFIVISVTDNGIGIPKEARKQIFEKFYRVSTGNLHDTKGFGLGLTYTKTVAEAHQGFVRLFSEPGKGSTFELHLPLQ